jgi:hypothetical protein
MPRTKKPPDWKLCEIAKSTKYQEQGCLVVPTGKGSDFLAVCPDRKPTLVEVKERCGPLTRFQKETRDNAGKNGFDYKVERCNCSKGDK